jgi:hypothetical protein
VQLYKLLHLCSAKRYQSGIKTVGYEQRSSIISLEVRLESKRSLKKFIVGGMKSATDGKRMGSPCFWLQVI